MIIFETIHPRQATYKHNLRPSLMATKPAVPELMKAPSDMRDVMSCWRTGDKFQPITLSGASWPNTYSRGVFSMCCIARKYEGVF